MSDVPKPAAPSQAPAGTPPAWFSNLATFFTASPVGSAAKIIIGSDFSGVITRLAGVIFVAGNVYARPAWIGAALLIIGMAGLIWSLRKERKRVDLGIAIFFLLLGLCFVIWRNWILHQELEHVSSYDLKSLKSLSVGKMLDAKTILKTTHGGIVAVTVRATDLAQKSGPVLVRVNDESGLRRPNDDAGIQAAIDVEATTLHNVITSRKSLTFLIGPGGMAKETILRQWVYALSAAKVPRLFEHVFLLTIRDTGPYLESQPKAGLQDALANAYAGIVDSPEYFDLLLRNEHCLIVVSEWDSIKLPQRISFLKKIADLVASPDYRVSVVVGTKPESLLKDFTIDNANTFQYEPYLRFLRVEPWGNYERELYFQRQGLPVLPQKNYEAARRVIATKGGDDGIAAELAQNVDFLNLIVEEVDELSTLDCFALTRRLTNHNLGRRRELVTDKVFPDVITEFHRLAYDSSQHGTSDLEFSGHLSEVDENYLSKSGLVDINNGAMLFASPAVQSYFAVEGMRDQLTNTVVRAGKEWPPLYNPLLVRDVRKFFSYGCSSEPLSKELVEVKAALACSLIHHGDEYNRTIKNLITGITGRQPASLCESKP